MGTKGQKARRRRKHARSPRWRFVAGLALVLGLIAAVGALFEVRREIATRGVESELTATDRPGEASAREAMDVSLVSAADRPVYPYSVVPGGVTSVDELRAAIERDPVVADHYKDFNLAQARVVRLAEPRIAHVSYRTDDRVYWTRKPMLLRRGETVITDGTRVARTRCGNQVADRPGPTSVAEPPVELLDTPSRVGQPQPGLLASRPLAPVIGGRTGSGQPVGRGDAGGVSGASGALGSTGPVLGGTGLPPENPGQPGFPGAPDFRTVPGTPPGLPGTPGGPIPPPFGNPGDTPPDAPVPVPEPGSIVLLLTGLAGAAARRLRKRG